MPASRKNKVLAYALIVGTIGTFMVVALRSFEMRLETREGYPPASSFRADALGCRALYETLRSISGIQVARFLRTFSHLPSPVGQSLTIAGIRPQENILQVSDRKALTEWVRAGGSLIVALAVEGRTVPKLGLPDYELSPPGNDRKPVSPNQQSTPPTQEPWIEILQSAGVRVFRHADPSARHRFVSPVFTPSGSWLGPLYFQDLQPPWRVVAEADHLPVVIQRSLGNGTITLLADSYFLTNGSLAGDRETAFLGWLFRKGSSVLFDESHFGIMENPGIASLARRYGLETTLFVLLILALLFVWAHRYTLLPKSINNTAAGPIVPGQGGESVFVNLLRRSLPAKNLLPTSADLWRKGTQDTAKIRKLDQLLADLNPRSSVIDQYNQISQRLNERT
jgi:hypothetical protein